MLQKINRHYINKLSDKELVDLIEKYLDYYDENSPIRSLVAEENVFADIMKASRRKRKSKGVIQVIGKNPEKYRESEDNKMIKTIRLDQLIILTKSFQPPHHEIHYIQDASGKGRNIISPNFSVEKIIHQGLVRLLRPKFKKGMYKWCCGSIPGRGVHYAMLGVKKAMENDKKNTKYCLSLDIRHFYESIPHDKLKDRIRTLTKDKDVRRLLYRIIDSSEQGVSVGLVLSDWFGNYFLEPLDHYIKERILDDCDCNTARTKRHGPSYYFRYTDNILMFSPNKGELHKILDRLRVILKEDYGLRIKYDWQIFRTDYIDKNGKRCGRPVDFVGFKFYHDKVVLRKKIYKRIKKLMKRLKNKGIDNISTKDAIKMLSYFGLMYWSDAQGIYRIFLRPYIKISELRSIVKKDRKKKLKMAKMENHRGRTYRI